MLPRRLTAKMPTSTTPPAGAQSSSQSVIPNAVVDAPQPDLRNGSTPAAETPERLPTDEVRVSMSRVITAWGFGSAFTSITAGAIYVAFARKIGASDFIFGVLAAAMPLMSFLQVAAARMVERSGRRKRQMMIAGILGRLLWVVAALLPLAGQYFPHVLDKHTVLILVFIAVMAAGAGQTFGYPAFFSWMADLVPQRVRPTFFARRMQVGTCVALAAAVAGGWIADAYSSLTVYCVILALAGLAGLVEMLIFSGVREPQTMIDNNEPLPPLLESFAEPLRDPAIRVFLFFCIIIMFSAGLFGPFVWLHALERLDFSKTLTNLILVVAPSLGVAWSARFWSDIIKRHGNRPVMRLGAAGLIMVPLSWLVAQPDSAGPLQSWGMLFVITFIVGILAGGLDLASQNLVTGLSPHIPRSTMTALYFIACGLSYAGGTWSGGALAEWLGDKPYSFLGAQLTNYHVLFLAALLLRLINAVFVAPRLREPTATSTIATVKDIVPEFAHSFGARLVRSFRVRD